MSSLRSPQFWLAALDQYGNPKLVDGSHANRAGVEQALYLIRSLGLEGERTFACAEVVLTPVEAQAHNTNEEAIATLQSIGLRPNGPTKDVAP